jgi:predicted AlkP superfamily pyrophosphatase or phosphodiesterase
MMRHVRIIVFFCSISLHFAAQERPALVVGIVVDQMRNEFIYRYWNRFGEGGFKRLIKHGYYFRNAHYNYSPTYTGPGHASIYTGATPRTHGIVGNDWFNRRSGKKNYCVADTTVKTVGGENKKAAASPANLLCNTVTDELKLSFGKSCRVFSIAAKDRSAVLPAGHAADGVFWAEEGTGRFVSSTWYMSALPQWMNDVNANNYPKTLLEKGWTTLYPIDTYTNSLKDNNEFEEDIQPGKKEAVFPYDFSEVIKKNNFSFAFVTPGGNTITRDAAISCLRNENLGKHGSPDFLTLSFSTPDIAGHAFGPRSVEIEDIYLRLDKDLEVLLNELDKQVPGKYVVLLTADHGASEVPAHLAEQKMPGGYTYREDMRRDLKRFLAQTYNDSLLLSAVINDQVYLNEQKVAAMKLKMEDLENSVATYIRTLPGIAEVYTSPELRNAFTAGTDVRSLMASGYNHKLSGNIAYALLPSYMDNAKKGTTHGTAYNYDTHVPVIFYGMGIKKGESLNYAAITQIASTLCELLRINQPSCASPMVLTELFR